MSDYIFILSSKWYNWYWRKFDRCELGFSSNGRMTIDGQKICHDFIKLSSISNPRNCKVYKSSETNGSYF